MFKKPPKVLPLKFLFAHPAHLIAGGFGSGYSPVVPGTTGTLFAWASFYLLAPLLGQPAVLAIVLALAFVLGVWACQRTGSDLGVVDHGSIVWDEVVPFWCVLAYVFWQTPADWLWQTAAFVLFRIFDIVKPPPARYFDLHVKNGFGVMADDLFAAVYAVLALWLGKTLLV